MMADWVAVGVRGRGLARRRLGPAGVRRLAGLPSLDAAVTALTQTAYGHDVRAGMDLRDAQHAVEATLLWHLRILAGWARPDGAGCVRRLAAGFEIANVVNRLARLEGRPADPPYALGSLAIAWWRIAEAGNPAEVRRALAFSPWGDPGGAEVGSVRTALAAAWCRLVAGAAEPAQPWAAGFAALLAARGLANDRPLAREPAPRRHLCAVLGSGWTTARTLLELAALLPRSAAWALAEVRAPEDLWAAEARWWERLEADGAHLRAQPQPDEHAIVGLVALLAADAWRTRGALELAARGGGSPSEPFRAFA